MTSVSTIPFTPEHMNGFECKPGFQEAYQADIQTMSMLGTVGQCASIKYEGKTLFIGAWHFTSKGVVDVFIFPSVYADSFKKTFFREARWWVQNLLAREDVWRVQTWGLDTPLSKRWLEHLGFRQDAELPCYFENGESILIWGRTWCEL